MKTIHTDKAPAAIGPYVQGKLVGNLLFASGQVPLSPETGQVVGETIQEQTQQVLKNIAEILQLDKGETDKLYDLAVQTKASNPLPLDIAETVRENAVVRIALRVAKDLDATDEEWEDFMRRLKETRGEGGQ